MNFIFLSLVLSSVLIGQDSLKITHSTFNVNNIGQILALDDEGLVLYDKHSRQVKRFSEELLGHMTALDRTSSLKLLVFYKDIPAFQLLDNTLSSHGPIVNLTEQGMQNLSLVCASSDNTFWGYDPIAFELIRFDDNFNIRSTSGNMSLVIQGEIDPVRLTSKGNRVYLADAHAGLHVFDQFGSYLKTFPLKDIVDFDVDDDKVILTDGGLIVKLENGERKKFIYRQQGNPIISLEIQNDFLYLGDGKFIFKRTLGSLFE